MHSLEWMSDAFYALDRDWRFIYLNKAADRYLGVPTGGLLGQVIWDVFPRLLETRIFRDYQRAVETQRVVEYEGPSTYYGRWISYRACPSPAGLSVYFRDESTQKETLRALEVSEWQKFIGEQVMHHLPSAVACVDSRLDVKFANARAAQLIGRPLAQIINQTLVDLLPVQAGFFERAIAEVLKTGQPVIRDRCRHPDRRVPGVWQLRIHPVDVPHTDERRVLLIALEVSDQVEREQFQQEQIKRLKQINDLKDEFLRVISHELRSPLTVVMGSAAVLEAEQVGPLTPKQRTYVEKIQRRSGRLLTTLHNMIEVSQLRSRTLTLDERPIDVREVLAAVWGEQAAAAEEKSLRVALEVPEVLPLIRADANRLATVIQSLLDNAIKFSPSESAIQIRLSREEHDLRFVVTDSGPGIAPDDLLLLFQRFGQLDQGDARQFVGTGLGLYLSRALIEAHGGRLEVQSDLGQGSEFWFTLPLGDPSATDESPGS